MNETAVVVVRGTIAFFTLLIFTRMLGKQTIAQLTFFDYVLGITIGSIAATMTTDLTTRAWTQWMGLLVWAALVFVLQHVSLRWRYASKYMDGEPTVLIMNGKIMEQAMRKNRYRLTDLMEQLREKSIFDLGMVEFALLETDGKVSVLKKSQYEPLTPHDLKLPTSYKGLGTELVYDGQVVDQNLKEVGLSEAWLAAELEKRGIGSAKQVFLAVLDTSGQLFVDTYKDKPLTITDPSDYAGPY